MKKVTLIFLFLFILHRTNAQTSPALYTWVRNLTGATGYAGILTNVQSVYYTSTDVYISATCIPGYSIGPWNANPNTPVNQNFIYKITRTPVQNTGTAVATGLGHTGVWSNGVSIFNAKDGMSYNNAGVWNRNAYYWEGSSFDNCLGHPAPNGEYHHHVNPKCLYDPTDSLHHSPIIGYSFDGFPIYGAYGYTNVNGTGAIKRMRSSFVLNTGTTRANGPAVSSSYPLGCFIEDYTYVAGSGDLDNHNGRFCITPEYPGGIYAYFVTIDASLNPAYPFTPGPTYYGTIQTGNTGPTGGHNTIPGTAVQYTSAFVPSISIIADKNPACSGDSILFTSAVTNEGTGPAYQWKKNNVVVGTGSSYKTSSVINGDEITCSVTSNAYYLTSSTATSNSIIVSRNNQPAISGFSPSYGNPGSLVILNGNNFSNVTSVLFNGTSASFTINNSSQITAIVPASATSGIMTITNSCGTTASTSSFIINSSPVTLHLKMFIQGFYKGNGAMLAALDPAGFPDICDSVTIGLAAATGSHDILYLVNSVIDTSGNGTFVFPQSAFGNSYYILVKHRSSIETWTAVPYLLNDTEFTLDLTTNTN
jgi:hypothetical protein